MPTALLDSHSLKPVKFTPLPTILVLPTPLMYPVNCYTFNREVTRRIKECNWVGYQSIFVGFITHIRGKLVI